MKKLFDRRTQKCVCSPGDQVLALLPLIGSPYQAKFVSPYVILKQISDQNFMISTPENHNSVMLIC